jgi:hypothetical protein
MNFKKGLAELARADRRLEAKGTPLLAQAVRLEDDQVGLCDQLLCDQFPHLSIMPFIRRLGVIASYLR